MKKINEMDEALAKWIINASIDNGDFKGPSVNEMRITERSYWLGGEAVLGNPGYLPNIQIRFQIGENAEVQIHTVEFDTENLNWRPKGYWQIYNTCSVVRKLIDEDYLLPKINSPEADIRRGISIVYWNNARGMTQQEFTDWLTAK